MLRHVVVPRHVVDGVYSQNSKCRDITLRHVLSFMSEIAIDFRLDTAALAESQIVLFFFVFFVFVLFFLLREVQVIVKGKHQWMQSLLWSTARWHVTQLERHCTRAGHFRDI